MSAPPVISTPWAEPSTSLNSPGVNSGIVQWMTSGEKPAVRGSRSYVRLSNSREATMCFSGVGSGVGAGEGPGRAACEGRMQQRTECFGFVHPAGPVRKYFRCTQKQPFDALALIERGQLGRLRFREYSQGFSAIYARIIATECKSRWIGC